MRLFHAVCRQYIAVCGCADGSLEVACLERNKLIGVYHQSRIGIVHVLVSLYSQLTMTETEIRSISQGPFSVCRIACRAGSSRWFCGVSGAVADY